MSTLSRRTFSLSAVGLLSGGLLSACGTESGGEEATVTRVTAPNAPPTGTAAPPAASPGASPVGSPGASPVGSPGATPQGSPVTGTDGGVLPEGGGTAGAPDAAGSTGGASQVTITYVDFAFEPKDVTVAAGVDVTLNFVNAGAAQHQYAIDDLGILSKLINAGETDQLVFNFPAGTYDSYCPVPGHRELGMVGRLIAQ